MTVRIVHEESGTPRAWVGNDVVDLGRGIPARKPDHPALARRILAPTEAIAFREAGRDPGMLWAFWAGKEAAFKAVCKRRGATPVFRHAAFEVSWDEGGTDGDDRLGHVAYDGEQLFLQLSRRGDALHTVAWFGAACPPPTVHWDIHGLDREPSSRRAASSELRRLLIDASAELLAVPSGSLEVAQSPGSPGRRPPLLLRSGRPCGIDVSLSHHGRFLAWALLAPDGVPADTPAIDP